MGIYLIECDCGNVDPDEGAIAVMTPDGPEVGDWVVDSHDGHHYELGDRVD